MMLRLLSNTKKITSRSWKKCSQFSTNDSSDDDKISKPEKAVKPSNKNPSLSKLNDLLQQIIKDDLKGKKLDLAKPMSRRTEKKEPGIESIKTETVEKKIVSAVKDVAQELGGNTKQTESELLAKLLNNNQGDTHSLSDIIKDMKIDREVRSEAMPSRAQQVKQLIQSRPKKPSGYDSQRDRRQPKRYEQIKQYQQMDLFGSEPLGVFSNELKDPEKPLNPTWERLEQRELKLAVTHPPANHFQEMIMWTEQGKIWKFPIDNEQGMEDEHNVYFAEHVFMEQHLEPWCPQKGPLRHFMELVCVGLSKNHYMSVQTKKDHIEWYRQYFESKKKLLQDTGALPADSYMLKQIESE